MRQRGKTILVAIMCITSSTVLIGQNAKQLFQIEQGDQVICASNIIHERMLNEDTEYRESFEQNERVMKAAKAAGSFGKSMTTFTIPIVVHIMHTGEPIGTGVNISDAQVQSAIVALNEDYRKMPGTNGYGLGVDAEIEFCLASRDPNGNVTDGIIRVNASGLADYATEGITAGQGSGADETSLKALSKWDRDDYYNIWVVSEIEDNDGGAGIQGYAYFPNSSVSRDGTVILFNAFGTVGNLKSYTSLNRTTTHELGHAFFLYHTFQGNSCSESDCDNQGDRVCDTPPTVTSTSCNNPACSGTQQVENYLDYTSQTCMNMFTQGQKDRMRDAIQFMRPTLLTSLGCTPPNALDAGVTDISAPMGYSCSTSLSPVVDVKNFGSVTLTSLNLKYRIDSGSLQTYQYTGNIPSGETVTVSLPTLSTSTGAHALEVYSDNPNGGVDGFQSNDSFTRDFEVVTGNNVTVAIEVDNYGGETTWDVQNLQGDIIATGGPYPNNMYGTTYELSFCLPEDCFEFNIYDSYGDGICCGAGFGGYTITDASGNLLIENGDDFNYTENRPFCTSTVEELPEADFSASQTIICEGSSVQFSDQSLGDPNLWSWSFPGGSPATSSQQHPMVTYNTPGPKNVTLTVTNESGSDDQTMNSFIDVGSDLSVTGTTSTTSCYNSSDGSINVSVNGGSAPYSYDWSHGSSSQDVSGLSPGSYSVTVQDEGGCQGSASFSVTSPSQMILTGSSTSATCSSPGSATVSATGGSPGYSYLWNDSQQQTTSTASGLSAGTYTVTVTDSEACEATSIVTVSGGGDMTVSASEYGNTSCNGGSDGFASVNVNGGQAPYDYDWQQIPGVNSSSVSGLSAGLYTVTVTDNNGCQGSVSFSIAEPEALNVSANELTDISCNGGSDGFASVNVEGGNAPFDYNWEQVPGVNSSSVSGLSAGMYTVTVSDDNGCQGSVTISITEPAALSAFASELTNISCNGGEDGSISMSVEGGVGPYSYGWNGSGLGQTANPSNVSAGTYTVTVTDANDCQVDATVTLTEPSALMASLIGSNASCYGSNDGTLSADFTGGTHPYSYNWNGAGFGQTMNPQNVASGQYTVSVTDANGCENSATMQILEPSAIDLSQNNSTIATCMNDGTATVIPSGGAQGYSYLWSDPEMQITATAIGLAGGTYTVIVTDANGCQNSKQITVESTSDLNLNNGSKSNATCAGYGDGSATVEAAGGNGSYIYQWNDPDQQTGATATGLIAGVYGVVVTDASGCQANRTFNINEPEPVSSVISQLLHDSCGLSVGKVVLNGTGGTGVMSFLWDDADATVGNSLNGVSFGMYTAEITDENQCQGIRIVEVENLDCVGTTGIEELTSQIGMNIYPNPISGTDFTIALDRSNDRILDLKIIDITGKTIMVDKLRPGITEHRVALDGTEAEGIYMLQLTDGVSTTTERIVIIR